MTTSGSPAKLSRNRWRLASSSRRSIAASIIPANSATMIVGRSRAISASSDSRNAASASNSSRSSRTLASAPSCNTFTATGRSVAECRPVNLGDRTRREGLRIKRPVQLRHRLAELRLNRAHGDAGGIGRHLRLKQRQLVGDVLPHDVGAQAQHLAELDRSRAQFCQRTPETLAVGRADVLLADDAMDEVLDRSQAGDATAARRPRRQPVPGHRRSDLVEPLAMLEQRASDVGHRTVPVVRRIGMRSAPIIARRLRAAGTSKWQHRPVMIIDCARYVAGVRVVEPMSLGDAGRLARQTEGFVWVALSDPAADELDELSSGLRCAAARRPARRRRAPSVRSWSITVSARS